MQAHAGAKHSPDDFTHERYLTCQQVLVRSTLPIAENTKTFKMQAKAGAKHSPDYFKYEWQCETLVNVRIF